ncbi:fumarate hydratase [Bacteriovorax sp. PP10]|uniref:Fumarate hydratase n=1 Tax=Bacteriovorax antarcticus TaxID=3088717 RepID=A0ABU5VYB9_9BACT|nr:fumarate hydratase [Bacteriovorax sp. PP10]MEA9358061.1 fumarate hydratase [Bacteriovorax sp. PP10]
MKKKSMKKPIKTAAKKVAKKTVKKSAPKKAAAKKVAKKPIKKAVKKVAAKKAPVKATAKKVVATKPAAKKVVVKTLGSDTELKASLVELIRVTSAELPDDVQKVILEALEREEKNTTAEYAMNIIKANIELAKKKSQPLCQDTGTVLFFVSHPVGFSQSKFTKMLQDAVVEATKKGYLRQNSVDSLTGANSGVNLGPGHPSIHYHEHQSSKVEVKLMLKGGGCENVGAQYSLPNTALGAGRDLDGVRKVILDAVFKAQGKGCGPGVLGVTIGGDRGAGYIDSKEQLLRRVDDTNSIPSLAELETEIVSTSNKLGIGPMGFGGKTTLLGCKIGALNRLPASFFVSISYMCWAYRRQGIEIGTNNKIKKWLY